MERIPLISMSWQNELVKRMFLYSVESRVSYLIAAVGTGHGKSIIL
jgi:formate hydrogenlyase subunit 3/multisubunit Na+/H+ antiporter MnhD subunit